MFAGEIQVPVSRLRGVGPAMQEHLKALEITTVGELLTFWPRDWDDRTIRVPLSRFADVHKINTRATLP